jgi:hypothetical protein
VTKIVEMLSTVGSTLPRFKALPRVGSVERKELPVDGIRACLAELPGFSMRHHGAEIVRASLRSGMSDAELVARWSQLLSAVDGLLAEGLERLLTDKAGLKSMLALPWLVSAIQGVASGCRKVPLTWLAFLIAEGSDESFDAILPRIDRALATGNRVLQDLLALEPFARTTRFRDVFAAAHRRALEQRSPLVAFMAARGVQANARLMYRQALGSRDLKMSSPRVAGFVAFDARSEVWWEVMITCRIGTELPCTHVDSRRVRKDQLGLGRFSVDELPAYLRAAEKKLRTRLQTNDIHTTLHNRARKKLRNWLEA